MTRLSCAHPARGGELRVPWHSPHRPTREVVVWSDAVIADDTGDVAAGWLSDVLGATCRLVTTGVRSRRVRPAERLSAGVHPDVLARPVEVAFPRRLSAADDLRGIPRRPQPPPRSARAVADGPLPTQPCFVPACHAPYEEDTWKAFRVGEARLFGGGPCGRCIVTTTDQQTLARTPEPLRTLAGYRRTPEGEVVFGQNVVHARPGGRLRVGDAVVPET